MEELRRIAAEVKTSPHECEQALVALSKLERACQRVLKSPWPILGSDMQRLIVSNLPFQEQHRLLIVGNRAMRQAYMDGLVNRVTGLRVSWPFRWDNDMIRGLVHMFPRARRLDMTWFGTSPLFSIRLLLAISDRLQALRILGPEPLADAHRPPEQHEQLLGTVPNSTDVVNLAKESNVMTAIGLVGRPDAHPPTKYDAYADLALERQPWPSGTRPSAWEAAIWGNTPTDMYFAKSPRWKKRMAINKAAYQVLHDYNDLTLEGLERLTWDIADSSRGDLAAENVLWFLRKCQRLAKLILKTRLEALPLNPRSLDISSVPNPPVRVLRIVQTPGHRVSVPANIRFWPAQFQDLVVLDLWVQTSVSMVVPVSLSLFVGCPSLQAIRLLPLDSFAILPQLWWDWTQPTPFPKLRYLDVWKVDRALYADVTARVVRALPALVHLTVMDTYDTIDWALQLPLAPLVPLLQRRKQWAESHPKSCFAMVPVPDKADTLTRFNFYRNLLWDEICNQGDPPAIGNGQTLSFGQPV